MTFIGELLPDVCSFLLSEPIVWFVGVFLLMAIAALFKYIIKIN